MKTAVLLVFAVLLFCSALRVPEKSFFVVERKEKLSEYNLFKGNLRDFSPAEGVIQYDVNTPLFSNYAEKLRFIVIPDGTSATYNDSTVFDMPFGTILVKNFFYNDNDAAATKKIKIVETRLLVHQEKGWEAWPYIWNEEQTEAYYDPAGEIKTLTFVNEKGNVASTTYAIPNKNQCKNCHAQGNKIIPIGLSARQLNRDLSMDGELQNQLEYWTKLNILSGAPPAAEAPRLKVWDDPSSGSVDDRARAYLDANCGHCHSKGGSANTSGLFLDIHEKRLTHLGVRKTPVAAGRGAGNLRFDIVPGKPDQSILLFRMKTNDPAIAMPELGREQIHLEGVALIEQWIRNSKFDR